MGCKNENSDENSHAAMSLPKKIILIYDSTKIVDIWHWL